MDPLYLYLVNHDPERMTLVSSDGVAHYQVHTTKPSLLMGRCMSRIIRPARTVRESIVAEIEWRTWGARPVVRSRAINSTDREVIVSELLYKLEPDRLSFKSLSNQRYFRGNDDRVYSWRWVKGIGFILCRQRTGEEVAVFTQDEVNDGFFRGQKKWFLRIQRSTLDLDMIVLTFMIMEKKRQDKMTDMQAMRVLDHDDEPAESGGIECGS